MSNWIILILILMMVSFAVAWIKKKAGKGFADFPYQSKEVLCSSAERSFLDVLDKIVGNRYRVFAKVRLADIVDIKRGLSTSARKKAFNRIVRKHIAFIVCNANDLSIIGAIELIDKTHRGKGRQERDQFLYKTLEAAGIPVIRIKAQSAYSINEITGIIDSGFNIRVGDPSENNQIWMHTIGVDDEKRIEEDTRDLYAETLSPVCPKCNGELVKRIATKGQYAGQKFWGCSNFPRCKYTKKATQPPESRPVSP